MKLVELQAQAWQEVLEYCHKLGMTIPESGKSALDAVKDFIAAQHSVVRTSVAVGAVLFFAGFLVGVWVAGL